MGQHEGCPPSMRLVDMPLVRRQQGGVTIFYGVKPAPQTFEHEGDRLDTVHQLPRGDRFGCGFVVVARRRLSVVHGGLVVVKCVGVSPKGDKQSHLTFGPGGQGPKGRFLTLEKVRTGKGAK